MCKKCLNGIWFLTDLSHRQKPSSLRVGTVCCGFIWNKITEVFSFIVKHWFSYHINANPCCRYKLSKLIFKLFNINTNKMLQLVLIRSTSLLTFTSANKSAWAQQQWKICVPIWLVLQCFKLACVTPTNLTRIISLKSPPRICHEIFY